MNRRNFFQVVGAVALGGLVGNKATDFELRRIREDEDRAIRLARLAQDYQDWTEMIRAEDALRVRQIEDAMREEFVLMMEEWAA